MRLLKAFLGHYYLHVIGYNCEKTLKEISVLLTPFDVPVKTKRAAPYYLIPLEEEPQGEKKGDEESTDSTLNFE